MPTVLLMISPTSRAHRAYSRLYAFTTLCPAIVYASVASRKTTGKAFRNPTPAPARTCIAAANSTPMTTKTPSVPCSVLTAFSSPEAGL